MRSSAGPACAPAWLKGWQGTPAASKSGAADYNERLSQQRAESIVVLIAQTSRDARARFKAAGRGFQDTIKQKFPGIQIVAFQYGEASRTTSIDRATDILTAHPDLNGFFSSNEPATVGAAQAVKQSGQKGAAGKIVVVGFDSSPNLIEDLKAGVIDSPVIQNPYRMGYDGVKSLVDKLNGKTPERRIDTGVKLVTKENLASAEIQQLLGSK